MKLLPEIHLPHNRVDTVILPGGSRWIFSNVLLPDLQHSMQVLWYRRRWQGGEIVARYPRLLEEPLESRRSDKQQRPGWLRRRVPSEVERTLWDVEDRPRLRGEGALAVEHFQLPLQEAIGFVCAMVASVNRNKREGRSPAAPALCARRATATEAPGRACGIGPLSLLCC